MVQWRIYSTKTLKQARQVTTRWAERHCESRLFLYETGVCCNQVQLLSLILHAVASQPLRQWATKKEGAKQTKRRLTSVRCNHLHNNRRLGHNIGSFAVNSKWINFSDSSGWWWQRILILRSAVNTIQRDLNAEFLLFCCCFMIFMSLAMYWYEQVPKHKIRRRVSL